MWELIQRKTLNDFDGFSAEYSWYHNPKTGKHIMIFGDSDLYDAENAEPDFETENDEEAEEWFNNYEMSLEENLVDDIIHNRRLYNGANSRGARIPKAVEGYINQINLPDNMRLKEYHMDEIDPGEYKFTYITQGPFSNEDAEEFFEEFSDMLMYRDLEGIDRLVVTVISRDGKEYGYALKDYSFDENGEILHESTPNIVLEAENEPKVINLRKYGFVPTPNEDFSDDGTRFKVYYYDPKHIGDRRIRLSKATFKGDAYLSARYVNPETHKHIYFDDLNGVNYTAAVKGLGDLVKQIDGFLKKVDAGEMKAKILSDEQVKELKDKTVQLASATGDKWYTALTKIAKSQEIDLDDLTPQQRDQIKKEVEAAIRNGKKEDPYIVKILAKQFLETVLKNMKGTPGGYVGRSWKQGTPAMSIEDALKAASSDYISVYTSKYDKVGKELIDKGYPEGVRFAFKDLKDSTQNKIKAWAKEKLEKLYDFEYTEDEEPLEEIFDLTVSPTVAANVDAHGSSVGVLGGMASLTNSYEKDQEGEKDLKEAWYDDLDDSNEHARSYKEAALKVDPVFAQKIVDALEDYIQESQDGFISYNLLRKYAMKLGIQDMKPSAELSKVWHDVYAVASYYALGQKDIKRSIKLSDAQSAFSEVVNQVARDYRKNHSEEDKQEALAAIREIIEDPAFVTTDSEGVEYLSKEAISNIKQIAKKANLTQSELQDLSRSFFGPFGYKIVESLCEGYDFTTGDELISGFVNNMSDDDIDNNLKILNQYSSGLGLGRKPERLSIYIDGDQDIYIDDSIRSIKNIGKGKLYEIDRIKFIVEPNPHGSYYFFKSEQDGKYILDKLANQEA